MFTVGNPVTGKDFYDRTMMIKELKALFEINQNFMIKAPRRYGKTSLVKETLRQINKDYLYIDLRRLPRLSMVIENIMNYSYEQAGITGFMKGVAHNALALVKNAKHSLKINIEVLEYSADFFLENKDTLERFIEALNTLEKVASSLEKQFIVVFDEFQDISNFNYEKIDFLEVMRGIIQHHNSVTYVFLGSIEHLMAYIFENKKSPFFNFCRKFRLDAFDIQELGKQLEHAFKKEGMAFENKKDLIALLEHLNGHPSNTMLTMQKLFNTAKLENMVLLRENDLAKAYDSAYAESLEFIEQCILDIRQKKHYHDVIFRLANNEKHILSHAAVYQIYNGLINMGYLSTQGRGQYAILDGFLEDYLRETI